MKQIAFGLLLGMTLQGSPDYITNSKTMIPDNIPSIPLPRPGEGGPVYNPGPNYPMPPIGGPGIGGPVYNPNYPVPPIAGPGIGGPVYPGPGIDGPIGNYPIPPIAGPGIGGPIGGGYPGCKISGYYKHMCLINTAPDVFDPNTPYRTQYRCLRNAICRYKGGMCTWVRTAQYKKCMYDLRYETEPHNY